MTTWRHFDVGNVRHFVPVDRDDHRLLLDEGQRQMVIMALADLSVKSPGFDWALNEIARKIDNVVDERAVMYDDFRRLRAP